MNFSHNFIPSALVSVQGEVKYRSRFFFCETQIITLLYLRTRSVKFKNTTAENMNLIHFKYLHYSVVLVLLPRRLEEGIIDDIFSVLRQRHFISYSLQTALSRSCLFERHKINYRRLSQLSPSLVRYHRK